eukprot:g2860.t1
MLTGLYRPAGVSTADERPELRSMAASALCKILGQALRKGALAMSEKPEEAQDELLRHLEVLLRSQHDYTRARICEGLLSILQTSGQELHPTAAWEDCVIISPECRCVVLRRQAVMAEAAPMQVDADEGMLLYVSLLREVLTSQGLMVPGSTLMLAEKQLSIYHLAARLQDLRDPLLTFWRTGEESEALEEPFVSSIKKVKQVWQQEGRWNCNLKAKKVFGHPQAVKMLGCSIAVCFVLTSNLRRLVAGCGNDPIADLETKGFGLVLRMDKFMKDAIVLVSPSLQRSSEELSKLILREPDVWRRPVINEHDLFNPPSASFVKQVLRSATATVTPQKPRPAGPEDHTPEKEMDKSKAKNEDPGPKAYAKLLEAMLQELDFFAEPFQGLRWLENKKQLLVYHYAARMNEQKDAILQMIQGVEAEDRLEPVYARAVKAVKEELMGLFSEGHKFKKMFSHDHVIRFHTLKGLPLKLLMEWLVQLTEPTWVKCAPQDEAQDILQLPESIVLVEPPSYQPLAVPNGWCRVVESCDPSSAPSGPSERWLFLDGARARSVGRFSEDDFAICADVVWPEMEEAEERSPLLPLEVKAQDPENVLEMLSNKITDEMLIKLQEDGFVIVDEALPAAVCEILRHEMDTLLENDQMNSESYSHDEGALHHDIWETSLDYRDVRRHAPSFNRMETDEGLLRVLRRLPALRDLSMHHLRLQVNKGNGGCYTMHTDSGVSGGADGMQVLRATALFYLNEGWREEHGGELRIFPYPLPPLKIAPTLGRLVLFHPRLVHEVLPNYHKRYCFTLWCAVNGSPESTHSSGAFLEDLESMTDFHRACAACEAWRDWSGHPSRAARVPRPLRCLFMAELRPLLVRYVFRESSADGGMRLDANELPSVEVLEDYVSLSGAWASRGFCELVHRWIGRQVVSQGASNKDLFGSLRKGCQPGSGLGAFTMRFAEDVDEACQARELAEMRFAEAEQRWDMSAQLALADAETRRLDIEKKAKQWKSRAKQQEHLDHLDQLLRARKEAALEVEQQQAEEQLSTLQKSHRDEVSRLYKDCEEAKRSLAHQELRCLQLAEEAELLQDSKQEGRLLHCQRKDRRSWRRKNAVLKQHLKQSKKEQKDSKGQELLAKTKADAEAKLSDVQLAVSEEAAQLRLQLAEAQSAQRASLAQLEVQTAALQRTVQLNTELRTSIAKAEDEAKASYKAIPYCAMLLVATATRAAELEARAALEASRKELESAQEASGKELKEAEARHVEATKALQKAKADAGPFVIHLQEWRRDKDQMIQICFEGQPLLHASCASTPTSKENDAAREEVAHLTETCRGLRVDAAKATLLEREKISIEEQLSQASHAQSKLAKRIEAAEQTEQKLREELLQREVEVKNKLEHLQARNRSLQVTSAEAAEREAEASMRLKESEAKLKEESAMASAAQAALASAREAAEDAKTRCIKAEERPK